MSTTGKKLLKIQHMEAKQHASEKPTNHRRNQNMHRNYENENTTTQNLWDTVKAVLRGKFIAIQAHLKKQDRKSVV